MLLAGQRDRAAARRSRSCSESCSRRCSASGSRSRSGGPFAGEEWESCSFCCLRLGLAFFMRNAIAFVAGPEDRARAPNHDGSVQLRGLPDRPDGADRDRRRPLVIALVAVALKYSSLGRQTRALSDSIELSETTGIDTDRIVLITWAASAGLAGLAGILYALPAGVVNPNLGFSLILSIFAAVVVGGHRQRLRRAGRRAAHRRGAGVVDARDRSLHEGRGRVRRADPRAARPAAGPVRARTVGGQVIPAQAVGRRCRS